jgi:hypothetical protein
MYAPAKVPALIAAGLLAAALAPAAASKEAHRTLPLAADGRLAISTYKGSITVTCWDKPEAEISARIEPDGADRDADRKVAETEVRIGGGGSAVHVKSDYHRVHEHGFFGFFSFSHGSLPFVHYTVRMPATARLEIEDYKSVTRISGLRSDLKLHTYKGTVEVERLDGAADIDTYKGEVRVAFSRYSRASRFETYKGSFDVRLPRDSHFELDADGGRRGEIDSDFAVATVSGRRRRSLHSRGTVNGGGPTLRFESSRGSLRLRGE